MKLVAALAVCAGASAVHVDDLLAQIKDKIYTVKPNGKGFVVALEPYFTINCNTANSRNKKVSTTSCVGSQGAGGDTNAFTRKFLYNEAKGVIKYQGHDEGSTGNWPFVDMYMPEFADEPYWIDEQVTVQFGDPWKAKFTWDRKEGFSKWGGKNIGNKKAPLAMNANIWVKEGGLVDGAYAVTVKNTGGMKVPKDFPESLNPLDCKTKKWTHTYKMSADQVCAAGPQQDGCAISIGVKGKNGKKKLNHSISYTTSGGTDFGVTMKRPDGVCKIDALIRERTFECFYTKDSKAKKLVVRLPNVMGPQLGEIMKAGQAAIAPFQNYWFGAYMSGDREGEVVILESGMDKVAHAAVWVDRRMAKLTNEFDCSALFASTLFESELIAESQELGTTVQKFVQAECKRGNKIAVAWIQANAAPAVKDAREYVFALTDPAVGGAEYNLWASKSGF